MTTEQKQHICAKLARAMGWKYHPQTDGIRAHWRSPEDDWCSDPPNPFTDAAASRALVAWIAKTGVTWKRFYDAIVEPLQIGESFSTDEAARLIMTAPLETVALAAYRAIQP